MVRHRFEVNNYHQESTTKEKYNAMFTVYVDQPHTCRTVISFLTPLWLAPCRGRGVCVFR